MTASDISAEAVAAVEAPAPAIDAGGGSGAALPPAVEEERRSGRGKKLLALLLAILFILLLLLGAWYLVFRKPIANIIPPAIVKLVPSYQYSLAGATKPQDVAASLDGSLIYVTQTEGSQETLIMDKSGKVLGALHPPEGVNGRAFYVAVNPKTGEVYASDRRDGAVFIYKTDGTYIREFDHGSTSVWQPLGMYFDAAGNFYVGDVAGAAPVVHEFGPDGKLIRDFGASAAMVSPSGMATDGNGNLYVADSNNGRLLVFAPGGDLIGTVSRGVAEGNLGLPVGVALDDKNQILVVDSAASTIQVYTPIQSGAPGPVFVGKVGQQGTADGQFLYPNGMHLDAQGRIYVADYGNDRLQVWSY
ncbi:MAG: NHL repeat-containing protein [Chloroflexota bacterium]